MGEIKYKCTPNGWDSNRSYLICRKIQLNRTGKILFEVVNRWSCMGVFNDPKITESLKGVQYTKNELKKIEEIC